MSSEIKLPVEVIAEIKANRKVRAIKLLRRHKGIGLILLLIIVLGVIFGLYLHFT